MCTGTQVLALVLALALYRLCTTRLKHAPVEWLRSGWRVAKRQIVWCSLSQDAVRVAGKFIHLLLTRSAVRQKKRGAKWLRWCKGCVSEVR